VVALLAFWLLAVVVIAGVVELWDSWWVLPGIPVALVLLVAGFLLVMVHDQVNDRLVGTWVVAAVVAGLAATITVGVSGPRIYHERYGEPVDAVVTYISTTNAENGGTLHWMYHVTSVAGDDLGYLADLPARETAEGDRLTVSVDPHGLVPPVPVDRLGGTTIPAVILLGCFGVLALGALVIIAAAAWGYRRTGVPCSKASR
jgi:hypothetical protein